MPATHRTAPHRQTKINPDNPSVAQVVREHVHITLCGYTTTPPLLCALQVFGAGRAITARVTAPIAAGRWAGFAVGGERQFGSAPMTAGARKCDSWSYGRHAPVCDVYAS